MLARAVRDTATRSVVAADLTDHPAVRDVQASHVGASAALRALATHWAEHGMGSTPIADLVLAADELDRLVVGA